MNGHGTESRGADVIVNANLNVPSEPGDPWGGSAPFFTVIANSAQIAAGPAYSGSHAVGQRVSVENRGDSLYVSIRNVMPSEVLVLTNRP